MDSRYIYDTTGWGLCAKELHMPKLVFLLCAALLSACITVDQPLNTKARKSASASTQDMQGMELWRGQWRRSIDVQNARENYGGR